MSSFILALGELGERQSLAAYENCSEPSVVYFPNLGLPDGPLGAALPLVVLVYFLQSFTILCSKFFFPALSHLSSEFNSGVMRAIVMSLLATIPELCIMLVSTFLTQEDVGVNALVGSAVFNTLAIPGICALFIPSQQNCQLDAWSLSRDCLMYGLSLLFLALFFTQDTVEWYHALIMILLFLFYFLGIQWDKFLRRRTVEMLHSFKSEFFEKSPLLQMGGKVFYGGVPEFFSSCEEAAPSLHEGNLMYFETCKEKKWYEKLYFCIVWPMATAMKFSIPTFSTWCSMLPCLVWIGVLSYIISWMITIISYKLRIPDALMSLTVLGVGVGIPELTISLEVAKKGKGTLAMSNAIGSSIINTLLCLAIPLLVKMAFSGSSSITFETEGLIWDSILMTCLLFLLYVAVALNGFVLDIKIGCFLLTLYGIFVVLTVLMQLNFFFLATLPVCDISNYFTE